MAGTGFVDGFGREHDDLRVSVTDRCNLRCGYCMPEKPEWFPRAQILSFEETLRLVRVAIGHGVRKVRLTGGEPLVRRDLPQLVAMLAAEPGIEDLSLTTNGVLLEGQAADLATAGLRRVNVSLDTLDPERFAKLSRRDALDRVLRGIETARHYGLSPVKVNAVLLRGSNADEIETLTEHAREHDWELRFIEFMPLENDRSWSLSRVVTGEEVRRRIDARWPLAPDGEGADPHAPATRWRFRDGRGAVGFINSVTAPFCSTCSRLRLTSDGKFRVCLYDPAEVDLKTPLRAGASDEQLAALMLGAVRGKGRGGALQVLERREALPLDRTMHQIGG
jgi:cyclic pyranopterin phosphate synthase